jgi:hypothetical protein
VSRQVTIGVPVYRGEHHLEETVASILEQTHRDWRVVFSIDGPDSTCQQLCEQYLGDSRFQMVVQPERLGWVGNIGWLQAHAETEFWCYQQQDDIIDPMYLEVLLDQAQRLPGAAVVYCDMECFGDRDFRFVAPSVVGAPLVRQLALITGHFAGVAFRGLTRVTALRETGGGLVSNDVDDFAVETVWIAAMATRGDLIRVPATLYRKRYHSRNVHTAWLSWDRGQRKEAWTAHCHDLLGVALTVAAVESERWRIWTATLGRLTASQATSYLPWADMTPEDRVAMVDGLLARTMQLGQIDLPAILFSTWDEIRDRSVELVTQPIDRIRAAERSRPGGCRA